MGITQQIGASSLIKPGVIDNTAARPASPYEGQVIFQKDTDQLLVWNGTAWVEVASALTKAPRGVMGYVQRTAGNLSITGGATDLTGMSITFNAVAGRLYRANWFVVANKAAVDRDGSGVILAQSDNTVVADLALISLSGNITMNYSSSAFFTTSTGATTYKLRMYSFSGNMIVSAATPVPLMFSIEDIGAA